jgi:guanidinobutyrase
MSEKTFYEPLSGNAMPRFAGPATFMRLPAIEPNPSLDVGFIGVPMDIGASNRPGARFGPREIRDESRMLRPFNVSTGADPFNSLSIADIGDVPINTFNLLKSIQIIEDHYDQVIANDITPLSIGGDHTIVLPILRALKKKYGKVGVIHVDAHADINDEMFGEKIAHGTPFRRAMEEGLIEGDKVVQIGLRGTGYSIDEYDWAKDQGFRVVQAEECWYKSLAPLMAEVREQMGDHPVYISFDIDGLDPAFAPGTGTAEVGGLTIHQGIEIVRGCKGMNVIGGDLVEVSPPFDTTKNTSVVGANLLYEMLCVLPGVNYVTR